MLTNSRKFSPAKVSGYTVIPQVINCYCVAIYRLVIEEDSGPVLYFTTNNSLVYKEREIQGMTIHENVGVTNTEHWRRQHFDEDVQWILLVKQVHSAHRVIVNNNYYSLIDFRMLLVLNTWYIATLTSYKLRNCQLKEMRTRLSYAMCCFIRDCCWSSPDHQGNLPL